MFSGKEYEHIYSRILVKLHPVIVMNCNRSFGSMLHKMQIKRMNEIEW